MPKSKITDKTKFIELTEKIPIQNIVGMETETYTGSYSEGINWDFLKYVYDREHDTTENSAWADYTVVYKALFSPADLVSDFDDMQHNGIRGSKSAVTVIYIEER